MLGALKKSREILPGLAAWGPGFGLQQSGLFRRALLLPLLLRAAACEQSKASGDRGVSFPGGSQPSGSLAFWPLGF